MLQSLGMKKHGISGHTVNNNHFTGRKGGTGARIRRKGLTRKQRRMNQGIHINKYD